VIGENDTQYLHRRAEEERKLSEAASGMPARLAHRRLAELFEREAKEMAGSSLHLIE
jgi:hypothetical protein